ncbi:MAG: C39 family peptidase [Patescibacteria group bacterium]
MAKIRYIRQRDEYSCGPVAIVNALKFIGINATHDSVCYVSMLCNCCRETGTEPEDIERAFKALEVKFKRKIFPTLKEIDDHIDNGGALLLDYFWSPEDGHYTLCIGRTPKYYVFVNDEDDKTIARRKRNTLRNTMKWCRVSENPWCWFIFKDKK